MNAANDNTPNTGIPHATAVTLQEAQGELALAVGKTCVRATRFDSELLLEFSDNTMLTLEHRQDCCETVWLEDICGDLADLQGAPILHAEAVCSPADKSEWQAKLGPDTGYDGATWTFYKLATIKGSVTLRWCGASNGYYSETINAEWRNLNDPNPEQNDDVLLQAGRNP